MAKEFVQQIQDATSKKKKQFLKKLRQWKNMIIALLIAGIMGGITVGVISYHLQKEPPVETAPQEEQIEEPIIITEAALAEIININELSTCSAVYKGIATVYNEQKPENIDYHVKYIASVDAGIDISQINISVDNDLKEIRITLPEAAISNYAVQIESLEFMFYNEKANQSEGSKTAYAACKKDVEDECKNDQTILELAKENAINIIRALTEPFVEELDEEYVLYVS